MIPSFNEMIEQMNSLNNVLIYPSAQINEYGVIVDHEFMMSVNSLDPSDEFLELWITLCSIK